MSFRKAVVAAGSNSLPRSINEICFYVSSNESRATSYRTTDCRRVFKHLLKVGRTRHKNNLVSRHLLAGKGNSDIRESLVVEKIEHTPLRMSGSTYAAGTVDAVTYLSVISCLLSES